MPKVNLRLKNKNLNKNCENDSFTVPSRFYSRIHQRENNTYSIKLMPQAVSQIFSFPVIKRTTEQSRLIRILNISGILALNMWCLRPESTFKVLYYTVKISDALNFGRFYFRTLFLSEIKIVRNFLQVMYSHLLIRINLLSNIWSDLASVSLGCINRRCCVALKNSSFKSVLNNLEMINVFG